MNAFTVGPANPDRSSVESDAQSEILDKAKHLVPLCGPMWPLGPRPAAVIDVEDGYAKICAYHDGARGLKEANDWALERAYEITHACCPHCYQLVMQGKWEDLRKVPAKEPTKFQLQRRELAVYCARVDGDTGRLRQLGELTDQELRGALT